MPFSRLKPAQLGHLVQVDQGGRPGAVEVELDEDVGAALHEAGIGELRLEAQRLVEGVRGEDVHQRSSRTNGTPSAPGAPSRRFAIPDETITSTTMVITYGSAWNSSGAIVTPRAWSVNGSAWKAPKK